MEGKFGKRELFTESVTHLNVFGFKAAVAVAKDKSLCGRPFVIAGTAGISQRSFQGMNHRGSDESGFPCGGRTLTLDCSAEAINQGIRPGMPLAAAERQVKDLIVLPPDPPAYEKMNRELERLIARYAPVWENDQGGNLYLDISGTSKLFGPPLDCSSRLLRDIFDQTEIRPATAIASNKLVSKVATRAIRPAGLIQVNAGTEAEFLSHQDIRILPGMGPKLLQTAAITGIREIGEIACLSDAEAISLFGKKGVLLRNMALGIDLSPVGASKEHRISARIDFNEDTIEEDRIRSALYTLAENGGLKMRNEKLGMSSLRVGVIYSDGFEIQGLDKFRQPLVLDKEICIAAHSLYKKTVIRRIRLRSIGLSFEGLSPLSYQPDLFEPLTETKNQRLQEAIDKIQNRYGAGKVFLMRNEELGMSNGGRKPLVRKIYAH